MTGLIDEADSILVVIDVQPRFLRKLENEKARELESRIRWIVEVANLIDVPVVATVEMPEDNGPICDAVSRSIPKTATVHVKPAFGVAHCPDILSDIARYNRHTAVLTGLETDVCILQSAVGLRDAGWRVAVIEDAVAAPSPAHEQGLRRMRDNGIEIIGVKGLFYEWLRTIDRTRQVMGLLGAERPAGVVL